MVVKTLAIILFYGSCFKKLLYLCSDLCFSWLKVFLGMAF